MSETFAFTAEGLLGPSIFPFVQGWIESFVLRGQESETSMEALLHQCVAVGRHTGIIWIRPNAAATKYIWAEHVVRPFGQFLPYQCPECKSVWCWAKPKHASKTSSVFKCRGSKTDGTKCLNEVTITAPDGAEYAMRGHQGHWMKVTN